MNSVNKYMEDVYKSILILNEKGYIKKIKFMDISKYDNKVLNHIFHIYKIWRFKISKKVFKKMVITNSAISGDNLIISGLMIAAKLEKIMK